MTLISLVLFTSYAFNVPEFLNARKWPLKFFLKELNNRVTITKTRLVANVRLMGQGLATMRLCFSPDLRVSETHPEYSPPPVLWRRGKPHFHWLVGLRLEKQLIVTAQLRKSIWAPGEKTGKEGRGYEYCPNVRNGLSLPGADSRVWDWRQQITR